MQTNDLMQSSGQAYETGGKTKDERIADLEAKVTRLRAEKAALVEALERIYSFESEGVLDDEDAEDMLDIAQRALAAAQEDNDG